MTMARVWTFLMGWNPKDFAQSRATPEWSEILEWPPDVFALCCAILKRSGAYAYLREGTLRGGTHLLPTKSPESKVKTLYTVAGQWQKWLEEGLRLPSRFKDQKEIEDVGKIWAALWHCRHVPLFQIPGCPELLENLIEMIALADEVSQGSGLPLRGREGEEFRYQLILKGWRRLEPTKYGSTLCTDRIHPSAARVLPKMHLPSSGFTLRSLSHHLAYCETDEVQPRWFMIPGARGDVMNKDHINLLLLPWPPTMRPAQIRKSEVHGGVLRSSEKSRLYFTCSIDDASDRIDEVVDNLCGEAERILGPLHGVVMPESCLTDDAYHAVRQKVLGRGLMLVAGVGREATPETSGDNYVCVDVPLSRHHAVHFHQEKHHRWRLDGAQIKTYGIGARLDPEKSYWEDIEIGDRRLLFLVLRPWLVTSVLICEDLARHDPVGELLRGVGPHLVIALLMDGPQLVKRWPSRYATALADDPGCSVVTLSSLGMAGLSRPEPTEPPSRTVALWKEADGSANELAVPPGADALVLTISVKYVEEVSADARHDKTSAAYPVLTGVHPVSIPPDLGKSAGQPVREREKQDGGGICILSAQEAAALARLAQQDVKIEPSPAIFGEFTGEARRVAQEASAAENPLPGRSRDG